MVSLVNYHTNATSKRWHLCEIDSRFALNSTPGWFSPSSTTFATFIVLFQLPYSAGSAGFS